MGPLRNFALAILNATGEDNPFAGSIARLGDVSGAAPDTIQQIWNKASQHPDFSLHVQDAIESADPIDMTNVLLFMTAVLRDPDAARIDEILPRLAKPISKIHVSKLTNPDDAPKWIAFLSAYAEQACVDDGKTALQKAAEIACYLAEPERERGSQPIREAAQVVYH